MMFSQAHKYGKTIFPAFTGERVYMREFTKKQGLPSDLKRWQPTVDRMLDGVDSSGPVYLMVDQGIVKEGTTHRRGGVHVDGYWMPDIQAHGGGPSPRPGHRHPSPPSPGHNHRPQHMHGGKHGHIFDKGSDELIILASNVLGCRGFNGEWSGKVGKDGDCSHIDVTRMDTIDFLPEHVYMGDVFMLHESIQLPFDTHRQVVRLNVVQ